MLIKRKKRFLFVICLLLAGLTASCSRKEDAVHIISANTGSTCITPESGTISATVEPDQKQNKSTKPDCTDVPTQKPGNTYTSKAKSDLAGTHTKESGTANTSTTKTGTKKSPAEKAGLSKKTAAEPTPTQPAANESKAEKTTSIQTYSGFIIDKDCLDDPGPEKDTIDCLLMDSCRESGYGLSMKKGNGYLWYEFDSLGKDLAYDILKSTRKYKQISVTVEGTPENQVLQVSKIYENQDN